MTDIDDKIAKSKKKYNAQVEAIELIGDQNCILIVKPDEKKKPHLEGQYLALGLGEWEAGIPGSLAEKPEPSFRLIRRAYSIGDDPDPEKRSDENSFQFYTIDKIKRKIY